MNSSQSAAIPLQDLLALPVTEKLTLIGALWDSIEDAPTIPVPPWQIEELDRRDAAEAMAPELTVPWDAAQQLVRERNAPSRSA